MMSIQIAVDSETNDIIKVEGGGIARVSDGRYTVQLLKAKLLTQLGEWKLDPRKGWINFDDYKRNPDLFNIEMRVRVLILNTKGVQKIDTMTLELGRNRVLILSFTATTIYGEISLTVPWSS